MKDTKELAIPTFDELISTELQKYNDIIPKVEELKKEYLPLKITSIDDKEGYELVKNALKFMIGKRHDIEDKRKELKADSLKFGRAVDEKAKEIQAMIAPIEEHLKSQKDRIDDEIRELKEAEEKAIQEKKLKRHNRLFEMGFVLFSSEYAWYSKVGDRLKHSIHQLNVEDWEDDKFDTWCNDFQKIIDNEALELKQQEEKEAIERAEFQKQQSKLLEEQNKLKLEQEAMAKEMLEMKEARTNMRMEIVNNLGLVLSGNSYCYKDKQNTFNPIIGKDLIENATKAEWDENIEFWKKEILKLQLIDVEIQKQREIEEYNRLEALKKQAEEDAANKLKKEQEEAKIAEQARIDGLSDLDKYKEYLNNLTLVEPPIFKTKKYNDAIGIIQEYLLKTLNSTITKK
jgi:hypothetical protein